MRASVQHRYASNATIKTVSDITALRKEVEDDPIKKTDELPIDVLNLIEQATIVADQKTDDGKRTLEQTQAVLKELRLSVAQQFIPG